jgi:hypothetical protein
VAIFAWLLLTFVGDLGVMGTAIATDLPTWTLLATAVANPVEAFRLASLTAFEGSLDVLGPAGRYAVDTFGTALSWYLVGVIVVWAIVPPVVAGITFAKQGDV